MTSYFFTMVILGLTSTLAADKDTELLQKHLAALEGEWIMVSGERDGIRLSDEQIQDSKRLIKDGETSLIVGGQVVLQARYTIDPAKKPHTIDLALTEGPFKGRTQIGIYDISGDTLKFCFAPPDSKDRPTEFATKEGTGRSISIWKRVKK